MYKHSFRLADTFACVHARLSRSKFVLRLDELLFLLRDSFAVFLDRLTAKFAPKLTQATFYHPELVDGSMVGEVQMRQGAGIREACDW
jgi:hypothetical protein